MPTGNEKGTLQKTKKKSLKGETSKGTKKRDTGNIIIKLFITIRTNNAITHFFKNEMIFNTKTIIIHKVITLTFLYTMLKP